MSEVIGTGAAPAAPGAAGRTASAWQIIREALRIGYSEMRLDSLPTMVEATSLYRKAGFVSTGPYYETPVEGTLFFARALARCE